MKDNFISSYHTPGCSHYVKRAKNAIFISNANKFNHELAKCVGALQLHRFGDIKISMRAFDLINELAKEMEKDMVVSAADFITEAVVNQRKGRRVDLVCLKNNVRYEFENCHKISKVDDDAVVVTIYI